MSKEVFYAIDHIFTTRSKNDIITIKTEDDKTLLIDGFSVDYARVNGAGTQSITDTTLTELSSYWSGTDYNGFGLIYTSGNVIVEKSGIYLISYNVYFGKNGVNNRSACIVINDDTTKRYAGFAGSANEFLDYDAVSRSCVLSLTAGQRISTYVNQTSGQTVAMHNKKNGTLTVTKLY